MRKKQKRYIGFWSVLLAVVLFPLSLLPWFVRWQSPPEDCSGAE